MSREITGLLDPKKTKFEYDHKFYLEHRLNDALVYKNNPSRLNDTENMLVKILDDKTVWDVGGSAGPNFFKIAKNKRCNWIIWEVKESVEYFKKNLKAKGLEFKEINKKLYDEYNGERVLFSRQALQYFENPLDFLKENIKDVKYICLMDLLVGKETFLTYQERVGPCWILGLDDVKKLLYDFNLNIIENGNFWDTNNSGKQVLPTLNIFGVKK